MNSLPLLNFFGTHLHLALITYCFVWSGIFLHMHLTQLGYKFLKGKGQAYVLFFLYNA